FINHHPPTQIYTHSLHDALPISIKIPKKGKISNTKQTKPETYIVEQGDTFYGISKKFNLPVSDIEKFNPNLNPRDLKVGILLQRSEEHTSELQSRENLVCRLLLE